MKYNRLFRAGVLLCLCLLLAACGRQAVSEPSERELPADGVSTTPGPVKDELMYINGNEPVDYTEPAESIAHTYLQLAADNAFYVLDTCYQQESASVYLQRIDGETGVAERISLSSDTWGMEDGFIQGMDVVDSERLVFWVRETGDGDGGNARYYAIYTDTRGQMQEMAELTDTLRENAIWESVDYNGRPLGSDGQGNIYIDDKEQHSVYVLDADGRQVASRSYPWADDSDCQGSFRTSDGERIVVCGKPGEWEWLCLDAETATLNRIAVSGIKNVQKWYAMTDSVLYYAADQQLIGWNTATGERRSVAKLDEITNYPDALDMAVALTEGGIKLLITEKGEEERFIITLSENKPEVYGDIVVANLYGESSFLAERVSSFSRKNPGYEVQYQAAYGEEADRVRMEVANGGGPDILLLSSQDAEALRANGALGELGSLISSDVMTVLLPGAVQAGTWDDKLYALPISVYVRSLLTSRTYWKEDTWTTEDILSLLKEHKEIKGLFVDISGQDEYFYNMLFMVGMNLAQSPFIEESNSRFDSPQFRDILITVKEMTQKAENSSTPQDHTAPLVSGEYLGVECIVWDMKIFSETCEKLGDNANLAGYPADMGGSHFLTDNGMLVVNQNAMDKPGVKELVDFLLSLESQQMLSRAISIRADIPESQLAYNTAGKTYYWKSANNNGFQLPAKADGSSYLEEYVALIHRALPMSYDSDEMFMLVMEEADSYFNSDKDLDSVVELIQRRVQLYLDERK